MPKFLTAILIVGLTIIPLSDAGAIEAQTNGEISARTERAVRNTECNRVEKSTDITGYGEFDFGDSWDDMVDEYNLQVSENETGYIVGFDDSFSIDGRYDSLDSRIIIESITGDTIDSILVNIDFEISQDLDDIGDDVRDLKAMFLDTYSSDLVDCNVFHYSYDPNGSWEGILRLTDSDGDLLAIHWDAYDVRLMYCSAAMMENINNVSSDNVDRERGRI